MAQAIGQFGGNMHDVSNQRIFASVPIKKANLYHTVETRDAERNQDILPVSRALGYEAELIMQLPLPRTVKTRRY